MLRYNNWLVHTAGTFNQIWFNEVYEHKTVLYKLFISKMDQMTNTMRKESLTVMDPQRIITQLCSSPQF